MNTYNLLHKMQSLLQQDSKKFFEQLGGLHGSEILNIFFDEQKNECSIQVDDLYANFIGLPQYKDLKNIIFSIATNSYNICIDKQSNEVLSIYDIELQGNRLKILFSPSGYIEICFSIINLKKSDQMYKY